MVSSDDSTAGQPAPSFLGQLKVPRLADAAAAAVPFLSASTAACVAETITIPIDTLKLRMQISTGPSTSAVSMLRSMIATDGLKSLWRGLIPGYQRQFVFGGLRVGLYESVRDGVTKTLYPSSVSGSGDVAAESTIAVRALSGAISGSLAMLVASPTDLVKVRLQSQAAAVVAAAEGVTSSAANSSALDRPYRGSLDAYSRIMREEGGLRALWRGCGPNVARNAIVNMVELMTYDTAKQTLRKAFDIEGLPLHVLSAMACGLAATMVGSPVDVLKSRMMASRGSGRGLLDIVKSTAANEGIGGFYKGFAPNFFRMSGWNIVFFVTYEQIKAAAALQRA